MNPNVDNNAPSSAEYNRFEYDYQSAGKGDNLGNIVHAAIETSMQSYSQGIGRHLGSSVNPAGSTSMMIHDEKKKDEVNVHSDEESHDKDDIITNGYGNTNRAHHE